MNAHDTDHAAAHTYSIRTLRDVWLRVAVLGFVVLTIVVATLGFAFLHAFDPDPRPRFALTDHHGRAYTEAELHGNWSIVYFGFTECPHVCPTQMAKITRALRQVEVGSAAAEIQPVFITVDPANDDADTIKRYLEHFHPRFVGLTGDAAALEAAARAFRVVAGESDADGQVAHTSAVFVLAPSGRIVAYLPYEATVAAIAERLAGLIS